MLLALDTPDIEGQAASGQGAQTVDAIALLQFIASATAGQGSQTVDAAALLQFVASASAGQGGQTVDAAALEQFIASATSGQSSGTVDAAALLQFIASAEAGQATQSVDAAGLVPITGTAESAQGAQSVAGAAEVPVVVVIPEPGVLQFGGPPQHHDPLHIVIPAPLRPRRYGSGASGQSGGSAEGSGDVVLPARLAGQARTAQRSAQVIAIGTVDNRRPRNLRKARLAVLLLAA